MITNSKDFDGLSTHNKPLIYYCLSTDEYPTTGVLNGAFLIVMDKKEVYIFDQEHLEWKPMSGSDDGEGD